MLERPPLTTNPLEEPVSVPPMPFDELWKKLRPKLYGVLARYGIPFEDAEDLIQTTMVQYLYKQDRIRQPEHWLPVALANTCKMYWRSRGRSNTVAVDDAVLEIMSDAEAPQQELAVQRKELGRVVGKLKERCRKIITMRYMGYDRHEIADRTGYKISGIDKVAKRCIDDLGRRFRAAASGLMSRMRKSEQGKSKPKGRPDEEPDS